MHDAPDDLPTFETVYNDNRELRRRLSELTAAAREARRLLDEGLYTNAGAARETLRDALSTEAPKELKEE